MVRHLGCGHDALVEAVAAQGVELHLHTCTSCPSLGAIPMASILDRQRLSLLVALDVDTLVHIHLQACAEDRVA